MKKFCVLLLALALLVSCVLSASAQELSDTMFENAKEAVSLISYGEFGKAIKKLNSSAFSMDESDLKSYIKANCRSIFDRSVQRDVAVAWYDGSVWALAVPFEAPDDDAVGALVFYSSDGAAFDDMAYMNWGDVVSAYTSGSDVHWNVAYEAGYIIVGDW